MKSLLRCYYRRYAEKVGVNVNVNVGVRVGVGVGMGETGEAEEAEKIEEADGLLLRTMLSVQVMMDRRRRWRRRTTGGMRRWHSL